MPDQTQIARYQKRVRGWQKISWSAEDRLRIAQHFGLVSRDHQRLSTTKDLPGSTVTATKQSSITGTGADFTATISTPCVDRSYDTIAIEGWDIAEFQGNPIVLYNHNSGELPIGRTISVWRSGIKLKAGITLTPEEANPLGPQVRHLINGGFLRATSVRFLPLQWEFCKDSSRPNGINFLKQRLIEFSLVNLPCNPQATIDRAPVAIGAGTSGKSDAIRQRELELAQLKRGAIR